MIDMSQKPSAYSHYPHLSDATSTVTIRRATNVLFDGRGTRQQGWGVYFAADDSRFGFYPTKRAAVEDVARYGLTIIGQ